MDSNKEQGKAALLKLCAICALPLLIIWLLNVVIMYFVQAGSLSAVTGNIIILIVFLLMIAAIFGVVKKLMDKLRAMKDNIGNLNEGAFEL